MRSMSPMDAYRWFDAPVYNEVSVAGHGLQQLVTIDSRRIVLVLGVPSTFTTAMSIAPSPSIGINGGFGINSSQPPLIINHSEHGSLVQSEWWAQNPNSVGAQNISVIEIKLHAWPEQEDEQVVAIEGLADVVNRLGALLRTLQNGRYPQAEPSIPAGRCY